MTAERIVRRKLADEVFDRLRAAITTGSLAPGDLLPSERELMERFGVGRPAVREAMQALANLGLIAISHGERAKVRALTAETVVHQVDLAAKILLDASPDHLTHLKAARRFFERGMAREAALRAVPADLHELDALLIRQRQSLGDAVAFIGADLAFHARIAAISGNPIFAAVSRAMLGWLEAYHTDLLLWAGKEKFTLAEHAEILAAIAAGDPERAEAAMSRHLDRSAELYVAKPQTLG